MGNTVNSPKQSFQEQNSSITRKGNKMDDQQDHSKNIEYDQTKSEHQTRIDMESHEIKQKVMQGESSHEQVQRDQTGAKEEDFKGDKWLQDLTKSWNQHCSLIEGLDALLDAQKGVINLLQYVENTTGSTDDTLEKNIKPELVDGFKDVLLKIQKSCESIARPLNYSVEKLKTDISSNLENLEQFQKDHISLNVQQTERHIRELEDKNKQLKDSAYVYACEMEERAGEIKRLKSQIERSIPRKAPATLQLFYLHEGNTIKEIETELKSMLNSKLRNITFLHRKQASDIDPSKLVVVLYIVALRVGADAANAIKDIQNLGNAILLLIHCKDAHSLPRKRSSEVLGDEQFRHLCGIIDLAYKSGEGLYHCEMNETGINTLCSLWKQRSD